MTQRETNEAIVAFDENSKDELFEKVLAWYLEHECFNAESIYQCDAPQLTAPELLADIAEDILKFKVQWKDDV